jgi:L-arabinose isomerase
MNTKRKSENLKIGYLPLAHEVYWKYFPDHKRPALRLARQLKEFLAQFGTVFETGRLIDSPARAGEARRLFQANDVDVVVLATVTYSTPDDVILDLKRFPRPIVIWNTQASSAIPPTMDFNQWMLEHGVTGVPGLTNLMVREGLPYFLISGHFRDEAVNQSFARTFQAIRVFKKVWGARIGLFGHIYPGMIDFGYDPTRMYAKFGVATVPITDYVVVSAFQQVTKKQVAALAKELQRKYTLGDRFQGVEFTNSVQLALAMKNIVREKRLDALTVYCQSMWQKPEIGVVSCIGNSLLAQAGVFCTCEGDVPTALAGMMLEALTGKAVFAEIWTNDFEQDCFMMGHSGQMNLGLFEENTKAVRMTRHPWWDGCQGRGACLQLKMPPGTATLLSITSAPEGQWRMIGTVAEVLDREPVPLGAPNYFMRMNKPISEFLAAWGATGAAHHLAWTYGDWTQNLQAVAKIFQIEFRPI